ncbi:MAG: succinate dehydrogenase cytochrome b subunit [Bacteroidales bacterium]|nr:succinate dehydrogenase cytochrome b subunit [Bacteroidales bacterium]
MANIFTSSIGKKLIMSISGLFLILFLTLHMSLNLVSVFSPEAFEGCCEFMSLGIVSIMVPVLAFGFLIHIIYAFILSLQNYRARGTQRYAVSNKAKTDSWSARNMLILGIIVVIGIALHLTDFWADMQLKDWMGKTPGDPNTLLYATFGNVWVTVLYILWFAALWFHLTHGFWSAFQTIGWNNDKWLKRWKGIGCVVVTLLMLGFATTAVVACGRANGWFPEPKTEAVMDCCDGGQKVKAAKHDGCTGECGGGECSDCEEGKSECKHDASCEKNGKCEKEGKCGKEGSCDGSCEKHNK